MTEFIGKGEVTTKKIISVFMPYLTELPRGYWPQIGLYKQVPVKQIMKKKIFETMSEAHQKGSIDVAAVTNSGWRLLFRVQGKGHQGWHKSISDSVQKKELQNSHIKNVVIDLNIYECSQLFKERYNFVSVFEVASAMIESGVRPVMIGDISNKLIYDVPAGH